MVSSAYLVQSPSRFDICGILKKPKHILLGNDNLGMDLEALRGLPGKQVQGLLAGRLVSVAAYSGFIMSLPLVVKISARGSITEGREAEGLCSAGPCYCRNVSKCQG